MASLEQIQLIIEELGPATEEVLEVQQHEEAAWTVVLDEATAVGLDFMADQEKLVLSMELGAVPEDRKTASYEFMLLYNFNWPQSGGIKLGLDAPEGNVVLMFELNVSQLELPELQHILASFVEKARAWRELVAIGLGDEAPPDVIFDDFQGAIRV